MPSETPICIQTKFGYYLVNDTLVKCVEYRKLSQIRGIDSFDY